MKLFFVSVIIVCAFVALEAQSNYCNPSLCKNGKKHIACNNNGAFSSKCATNPRIMTITQNIKKNIELKHNKLRGRVARGGFNGFPGAVRMATMQWDNELAKLAELNVKQCAMIHDGCRSTSRFPFAGQNLASTSYFGLNKTVNQIAMNHINLWFNEYRQTTLKDLQSYPRNTNGIQIGHFTQMMQEKANRIGCSILRQDRGNSIDQFMACNYAYTNIFDHPVYRSGRTGSKCTSGRNPVFGSLCSTNEIYNLKTTF